MKILLVDDNDELRRSLKQILENEGYQVQDAANGTEAIRIAGDSLPDMIISDILMPGTDGFRLCHTVKNDRKLRKIPFIIYTAVYTDPQDEKLAMALGASRFIVKPLAPEQFLEILKAVIAEHREEDLHTPRMPLEEDNELYRLYISRISEMLDRKMTDLKRAQQALNEKEEQFRIIFENAPIGMAIVSPEQKFLEVNPALCRILGYSKDRLLSLSVPDITYPEDLTKEDAIKRAIISGSVASSRIEKRYVHAEGRVIWGELSISGVRDEHGKLLYYIGQLNDITEQKSFERDLKERVSELEQFYAMAVNRELRMRELKDEISRLKGELARRK